MAKESVEPHPGVPKVIRSAVFPLEQRRLRCKREPSLTACIQPRVQFMRQIFSKRNHPDPTFTRPNAKACLLQIEVSNAQMEGFSKSQAGAIQNQEQGSHALESQWRTLQIRYAVQEKRDLVGCKYARLEMSLYRRDGQHLFRHKPFGVEPPSI